MQNVSEADAGRLRTAVYVKGGGGLERETECSLVRVLEQDPRLRALLVGEENLWTTSATMSTSAPSTTAEKVASVQKANQNTKC